MHHNLEYVDPVLELLETQWPHEKAIREKRRQSMVNLSRDDLPCHLVLLQNDGVRREVIGHSLLKRADGRSDGKAAIVYSVVIKEDLRGRGLGRKLMTETEDYARCQGYSHLFLFTDDQVKFYKRLDYQECEPITSLGSNSKRLTTEQVEALENLFAKRLGNSLHSKMSSQTWMKKRLIEEYPIQGPYPPQEMPNLVFTQAAVQLGQEISYCGAVLSIPWQQQAGPSCGLVTCNMLSRSLLNSPIPKLKVALEPCYCTGPANVKIAGEIGSAIKMAAELGISNDGEMFCAYNMCYLSQLVHGVCLEVRESGTETRDQIISSVLSGYPCLVPYDRAVGNLPTLAEGRRAHWAIISGIVIPLETPSNDIAWNLKYSSEEQSCMLLDVGQASSFDKDNLEKVIADRKEKGLMVICVHGMSPKPFVCPLDELIKSNANLNMPKSKHFKASAGLEHLRGKLVFCVH